MKHKDSRTLMVDTWSLSPYRILDKTESAKYQNESSFQSIYSDIKNKGLSPEVLCVIEGRFGKDRAVSVNGRYYGENFWEQQLEKEQTQFLLRKGLMWMLFGHVDRGIEDKDAEKGIVAGIVTHLEVVKAPTTINGVAYNAGDLFGRAIIIDMEAGRNTYVLLSVGSEISISSRGLGEYLIGETHLCEDGTRIPIMNPDTYELETFDFTRLPGISDAMVHTTRDAKSERSLIDTDQHNQKVALLKDIATGESQGIDIDDFEYNFDNESLEVEDAHLDLINESVETLIFNIKQKENNMAKVNGIQLQKVLEEANSKIASLTAQLEDAEKAKDAAEEKAKELEDKLAEKTETIDAADGPIEEKTVEEVKAELTDSTPDNTKEVDTANLGALETEPTTADLEKFKDIAETPEELNEVLVKVQETLKACEDDAAEIERLRAERDNLKADLDDKIEECKEAEKVIESYLALGSIAELKAMVESNQKLKANIREQKLAQFVEHYSNKKGITQDAVQRIIESSKSFKDARNILEGLPNVSVDKGLYKSETKVTKTEEVKTGFSTFAESFIDKAEKRRNKSYTV